MKIGFYPKLAWTGIKKNKKIYIPYLLTCIGMIMMYYMIHFLSTSELIKGMQAGATMQMVLSYGCLVIGLFSLIFLIYTNSFLMKRRYKEFGLYHILGMGKKNIAYVVIWECIQITGLTLFVGIIGGIFFSKLGELVMIQILEGEVDFHFSISLLGIRDTLNIYLPLFLLILLKCLIQIFRMKPLELFKSTQVGEKPPKANWIFAILGIALLLGAYYISVSIEEPMALIGMFFVAVSMVIAGTYILFQAGSVVLCRILKNKKSYYYKSNHFISVSTMMFRMKRNGSGLASICILSTMVLVMVSAVSCLYLGSQSVLDATYPQDVVITVETNEKEKADTFYELVSEVSEKQQMKMKNESSYTFVPAAAYLNDRELVISAQGREKFEDNAYDHIRELFFIPIEDYNRLMGEKVSLEEDEIILYNHLSDYDFDTLMLENGRKWKIKKTVPEFVDKHLAMRMMLGYMFIFVKDRETLSEIMQECEQLSGMETSMCNYYGIDFDANEKEQFALLEELHKCSKEFQNQQQDENFFIEIDSKAAQRKEFLALYGGMFLLGILLGSVFLVGLVLIMYYKQVTEGYEDQQKFEILQKVGMSRKEIKRSINSQIYTVFFMPLLVAGVHTAFAFPIISKIIESFGILNHQKLLVLITVGCYVIFAFFYVVMYLITSKVYYGIVKSKEIE